MRAIGLKTDRKFSATLEFRNALEFNFAKEIDLNRLQLVRPEVERTREPSRQERRSRDRPSLLALRVSTYLDNTGGRVPTWA